MSLAWWGLGCARDDVLGSSVIVREASVQGVVVRDQGSHQLGTADCPDTLSAPLYNLYYHIVPLSHHHHQTSSSNRSPKVVIASAGMQADRETLHKTLHARHVTYQFNHRKPMSCGAMAQLLSNTLYYKRFFPYYPFNLCAGLDEEGRGAIYTYDAIGSYERVGYGCQGSGKELMQPVLDSQLKAASPLVLPPQVWII